MVNLDQLNRRYPAKRCNQDCVPATSKVTGIDPVLEGPKVLLDDPAHLPLSHWGSSAEQEFLIIEQMIASYVMPPQLTADLYRALGQIPGLRVDEHAVDLAGRTGIGFIDPPDSEGASDEIILSPRTYQLMGVNTVEAHHHVVYGTAILSQARVSSPGTLS